MALYLIGDIQGCDTILERLLDKISFSPSRDTLFILGDLVNRGPDSVKVIRRLMSYDESAQCILGNHDMHLLAVGAGQRKISSIDTFKDILEAPDRVALIDWLRKQPLARRYQENNKDFLMTHAGVMPSWTIDMTLSLAKEVHEVLSGPDINDFLHEMYSDTPDTWSDNLRGIERLRMIVNVLTRIRFCDAQNRMEFTEKSGAESAPKGFTPWFDVPSRQTKAQIVAFGHWSTLGWLDRRDVISMDTGCVWGGTLSALPLSSFNEPVNLKEHLISVTN